MKKFRKKFWMMLFALAVVILPFNVSAKTHDFSVRAYDWDPTANDWEGAGTNDEIEDNGEVKPGQIFKVDHYYKAPQTIEQTMTLQTGVKYNPNVVEPIWAPHEDGVEDDAYVETDMTTTAFGGLWPPRGTTKVQRAQTNWMVMFHDDKDTSIIKFLVADGQMNRPLTAEGSLSSVFFKVKESVASGTNIDLHIDDAYTKATGIVPGGLPKTTHGMNLKVEK